ncbi:MAG: galactokinase [Roseburia sp.]|nr:galactokinase [Roseburia sp.]
MKRVAWIKEELEKGRLDERMRAIYVDKAAIERQRERYGIALERFRQLFPNETQAEIYSAPGRSEVCGNHTDHQGGMVLAASVNQDAIAIVAKSEEPFVRLASGDFPVVEMEIDDLKVREEERNTTAALIRGVIAGIRDRGYQTGGFTTYITSDVLMGSGMSSSAAFESLLGTILSGLYNEQRISAGELAQIGQFAENVYFGKPCGLMDQMACSVGGMVYIDFKDRERPVVERVESDFEKAGISLCIVDTGGSHADLTPDYAAVPLEMGAVAKLFGKQVLREVSEQEFYQGIPRLRGKVSERALLRAIHFFEENKRVERAAAALRASDYNAFLEVIKRSGDSSAKFLQNIYSPRAVETQNVTLALALSERILGEDGVCRIHGGGFAGTIQAFVKNEAVPYYKERMEAVFGENSCHVLKIRPEGGVRVW